MDSRAPPAEAPPAYARAVTRVWRRDLRPIVLLFTGISAIWCIIVGVGDFRSLTFNNETSAMRLFAVVEGALAFALVGTQTFGFIAAFTQRLTLVKLYAWISTIAALICLGLEVVDVVDHFVTKQDQVNQCVTDNQNVANPGTLGPNNAFVSADILADCQSQWSRYTAYVFGWLVIALLWPGITLSVAVAYYHQLSQPSRIAPSSAYRLDPYAQDPPFQPPGYYPSGGDAPPVYLNDGKVSAPQEKEVYEEVAGYDVERNDAGDLSTHHQNYSEVTLTQGESGREREGRV